MNRTFYTDGACKTNPGPGGWAYVELVPTPSEDGYKTRVVTGNKAGTTNNEMELMAAYMAMLSGYKDGCDIITIYSDSAYVVNSITKGWLRNWQRNGWKTKEKKEVKIRYIWEKVYKIIYEKNTDVRMIHVRSHNGDVLNELADRSAVKASEAVS